MQSFFKKILWQWNEGGERLTNYYKYAVNFTFSRWNQRIKQKREEEVDANLINETKQCRWKKYEVFRSYRGIHLVKAVSPTLFWIALSG